MHTTTGVHAIPMLFHPNPIPSMWGGSIAPAPDTRRLEATCRGSSTMKTKSKRPSAPARRSRDQHRARARLLPPRAWRRYIPRGRALLTPRRLRRPFYSMGFARSAGALDIICAAGEASGSGVWRRLTRGRAQACVAWRRRAGAGRECRGAPGSARCLRAPSRLREQAAAIVLFPPHAPTS